MDFCVGKTALKLLCLLNTTGFSLVPKELWGGSFGMREERNWANGSMFSPGFLFGPEI